jgi:hypothetical protein
LHCDGKRVKALPSPPPSIREVVRITPMISGILNRKHDKEPRVIYILEGVGKVNSYCRVLGSN